MHCSAIIYLCAHLCLAHLNNGCCVAVAAAVFAVVDLFGTVVCTCYAPASPTSPVNGTKQHEDEEHLNLTPRSRRHGDGPGGDLGSGGLLAILRQQPRVEAGDLIALVLT